MSKKRGTAAKTQEYLERYMAGLERRNPGELEFHQAVYEVASTIFPFIADKPQYHENQILERMAEPDRVVHFRIPWTDDEGNVRTNRGFRVQFNSAIGPYKGGLRFHPSVNLSILKFLGYEQTFKNSLTGLPMGAGAKGGANFNPKGKSDNEVMRFCQSFITELYRHIGEDTDVPAGDIGVGAREIGYMFGQYKRITNRFVGVLTGKGLEFGGSKMRTEATGYGAMFFLRSMLEHGGGMGRYADIDFGLRQCRNPRGGEGSSAWRKATYPVGFGRFHILRGRPSPRSRSIGSRTSRMCGEAASQKLPMNSVVSSFTRGSAPGAWKSTAPCRPRRRTNSDGREAAVLIENGVKVVAEAANMPCEQAAVDAFIEAGVLFGPAKAVNAGGVGVSGLEMSQNSARIAWDEEHLRDLLENMMRDIHDSCVQYGTRETGPVNYRAGANIAGFVKVADAMLSYGHV